MKQSPTPSKRSYLLLLLVVLAVAFGVYSLTGGRLLDFGLLGRTEKRPSDLDANLTYGLKYIPSSAHALERDGIVLINTGSQVVARELSSDIKVEAGDIAEKSSRPIVRMAESVGYLYLYDGETVYRLQIVGDGKPHTAVKSCRKFEVMGDYIYSLQEYRGSTRLYRCSLVGSYEKQLFGADVLDFWAYGGNLLTLESNGNYRWYHVVTQNSLEHTLPKALSGLALDSEGILYLLDGTLKKRPYLEQDDSVLAEDIQSFISGPTMLALLKEDGSVWLCQPDGTELTRLGDMTFEASAALDLSETAAFVTQPDGSVWSTPLENVKWSMVYTPSVPS